MAHEGPINPMHSLCLALAGIGKWVGGAQEREKFVKKNWPHYLVRLLLCLLHLQAFSNGLGS